MEMTNQHKPPEFSELFFPFSCLIMSSLQAEGAWWHEAPALWVALGRGVLSLALPPDGVLVASSGAGLAWRHLSFLPELRGAADTRIPPWYSCPGACGPCTPLHAAGPWLPRPGQGRGRDRVPVLLRGLETPAPRKG